MRKLSMKSKRGRSGTCSDGDSEENGAGVRAVGDDESSEHDTSKIKKTPKKGRKSQTESNKQTEGTENPTDEQENGSPVKKRKKDSQKVSVPSTSEDKASTSVDKLTDEEYEVLKIVGQRTIKGRRQFLVRWKGYDEESWEQEKNLNCPQLIEEYLADIADSGIVEKSQKTSRTPKESRDAAKPKTPKSGGKKKSNIHAEAEHNQNHRVDTNKASNDDDEKTTEDTKEFEVEKILEVYFHKKNKTREFLIRWKGFSSAEDTWEPEENLNCPELISRFMDKVEVAKKTELRELRTNPAHTKRYTLMSTEPGRRLSRRNTNKQRESLTASVRSNLSACNSLFEE
ncbi:heterochromatin protein 1 isoform X1 [Neodiprion pinetum]|uniref:Heterochromatin protein 1 isoform X1 n=1 Tax=Neodiprion lecontei TaxID=441921 RepID=A0ABM3GG55_NEOLC|nr:heterochromatin protein 1-like isoform X1 [Neodiprion fabricii]XP_046486805.1 heterochromatin protein 1-like isoform X1 [Neodiprion pinetum]XP_046599262.1 heterochromatin protein 1 isoform X1 [Neodiprion lecontei]